MIAAAVAEVNKGIFVTDNEKHFQGINLIKSPPRALQTGHDFSRAENATK
jgi:hypothetical protein